MTRTLRTFLFVGLIASQSLILSGALLAQSALKVPSFFSNHMMVQAEKPIDIWGWAQPNEQVTVAFRGATAQAAADAKGKWKASLPAMSATKAGDKLTIKSGASELTIDDVLIGEVWFASGQSNMVWPVSKSHEAESDIAAANYPQIRMFLSASTESETPLEDIKGQWLVTTPQNVPSFSATGYFFALKLHQETGLPVGIIRSCQGGKRCECYCSREAMLSNENGKQMIAALDKQAADFDAEKVQKTYAKRLATWEQQFAQWKKAKNANKGADAKQKQQARAPRKPRQPVKPYLNAGNPTVLFNGMINPFIGYRVRGAIWYQGESNARPDLAPIYSEMFGLMIQDWRTRWNEELPFYFVQIANFRAATTDPGVDSEWVTVQNQQRLTLQMPKTGMATINDIGEANNIHPGNKKDAGNRLAFWALKNEYGKDVIVSGPLYKSLSISGNTAKVEFEHAGEGLKSRDGGELKRFEIAGADQKWHWGTATVEGQSVVSISCPEVPTPVAVRYGWASNPEGANLVNSAGLPTSVFRTDDWEPSFAKAKANGKK